MAPGLAAAYPALAEIRDFDWLRPILTAGAGGGAGGGSKLTKLDITGRLGRGGAAVLGTMLPRTAATMRDVVIRSGPAAPAEAGRPVGGKGMTGDVTSEIRMERIVPRSCLHIGGRQGGREAGRGGGADTHRPFAGGQRRR